MAKTTGPLFSLGASGTIGGAVTMLHQNGRHIAKHKSAPTGAPSYAQTVRRTLYLLCASGWSTLTAPQKAAWLPAAAARRITPFNAYMADALRAGGPIVAPPPPDVWHLFPVRDLTNTSYAPTGAPTRWQALSTPGDASYIFGSSQAAILALRPLADPGINTGHRIRYRGKASNGWLAIGLKQGAAEIASTYHAGTYPNTPTDSILQITPAQAANITDYAALSLFVTGLIGSTTFYSAELEIDTATPPP